MLEALNKTLALILWGKDKNGEDDVAVFPGTLIQVNDLYYLQRSDETNPEIRPEWFPRIERVPEDLKETLLECEFQLSLTTGESENISEILESFGLKWPE